MLMTLKTINKSLVTTAIALILSSSALAEPEINAHELYKNNCASCHGADHGGYLAPALNAETLKGRSPTALRSLINASVLWQIK
jgi:nitrite reductase (NO-forming) / hydroxylamine reductase